MFNVRKTNVDAQFEEINQSYETLEVETLTPHIGAKVRGVDLAQPLTNEQARDVHQAWIDWKVLVTNIRPSPGVGGNCTFTLCSQRMAVMKKYWL